MKHMGNKIPGSWFDDPEWEMLRRRADRQPVPRRLKKAAEPPKIRTEPKASSRKVEANDKEVTVSLKLTVPKLRLPDVRAFYGKNKRYVYAGAASVAVVVMVVFGANLLLGKDKGDDGSVAGATDLAGQAFNPLLPLPNATSADGQKQEPEHRYDQERKVLGFGASYNNAELVLSQQPVPDNFKTDKDALKKLAESMGATEAIATQKGDAYIGSNSKTGEQRAVFKTDEVLVFIVASKKLDPDEWQFYINQLQPKE